MSEHFRILYSTYYRNYYAPRPKFGTIKHWWPRLSFCLSHAECKSRTEWHGKLKIGSKEARDTSDPWPHLEVERSKVKVTRPINADMENAPYLPKEKTDELQTWNRDGVRSPTSPTCAVTSKVKGQGYNAMLPVWHAFAHNSTKWSGRSTKIGGKTVRAPADICISSNVKRSKVKIAKPFWVAVQSHYLQWRPQYRLHSMLDYGGRYGQY